MTFRLACFSLALSLPLFAKADGPPSVSLAECKGSEADASHVAIHSDGKASDLLRELSRFKQIEIAHIELVGNTELKFNLPCVSVGDLVYLVADTSGLQMARDGDANYRLIKIRNHAAISKLQEEADGVRGKDRQQLIAVLTRLVALSQADGPGEPASVEDAYHDLGNMAMDDKDYIAAERWYRARVVDLDRSGAAHDTNYGIAVSNVADALAYQDEIDQAAQVYQRALAILEKQTDLMAPANTVLILETLSSSALVSDNLKDAEALASRAWTLLSDSNRSKWGNVESALEVAALQEGELGRLGPPEQSLPHFERALELLEARYPLESAELIVARQQVMRSAGRIGTLDRVVTVAEQQLAAAEQRGERTTVPYVLSIYQLLALYAERGDLDRVIALWPRLIEIRRRLLGDNSPNVVSALEQLATLYRLNAQWALADATDQRAAAIKPVDDSEVLLKVETLILWAMNVDPATPLICAKFAWNPTGSGSAHIPPTRPIPPIGLIFEPSTTPKPLPADKLGQARYLEQTAECFSKSSDVAGPAMEQALRLRLELNGANSPDARRASERAIQFFQQENNAKAIERVRAISVE